MSWWRRSCTLVGWGLLVAILSGCTGGQAHEPTLKKAETANLPATFQGWSTTSPPNTATGQLNNKTVTVQVAFYYNQADTSQLRIANLTRGADTGDVTTVKNGLVSAETFDHAQCGTLPEAGSAITCVIAMDGGLLQVTGTSGNLADLAGFSNALYASLP